MIKIKTEIENARNQPELIDVDLPFFSFLKELLWSQWKSFFIHFPFEVGQINLIRNELWKSILF